MPAFTEKTPTKNFTFSDITFAVPMPFDAGHKLTANEASFLNSAVAGRIGNAYSGDLRRAQAADEDTSAWDHAERFAAKYAAYELGVSNRGSGEGRAGSDPVARLMRVLATEDLKARIIAKGLKVKAFQTAKVTVGDAEISKFEQLLTASLEANDERFRSMATAQLQALADAPEDDDFELPDAA